MKVTSARLKSCMLLTNIRHEPETPDVRGPEGVKQWVTAVRSAFPDVHFSIEDLFAAADKVTLRWTVRGTYQGEFLGVAPTGRQITNGGNNILRIADGRIQEEWVNWDTLGMMKQVGAFS